MDGGTVDGWGGGHDASTHLVQHGMLLCHEALLLLMLPLRLHFLMYCASWWRQSGREIVDALAVAVPECGDWHLPITLGVVRTHPVFFVAGLPPPFLALKAMGGFRLIKEARACLAFDVAIAAANFKIATDASNFA